MKREDPSIGKWISILHRQAQIYFNREFKPLGLNGSEYIYIVNLSEQEGVNQKSLSDSLHIDNGLTTRILKNLEQKGFIYREKDETDRRAVKVFLTAKGRETQPKIIKILNTWTEMITADMDDKDSRQFLYQLQQMSRNAKNNSEGN